MKYCICEPWQKNVAPHYKKSVSLWDSSQSKEPMYFGIAIDFCPFCGKQLKGENR